MLNHPFRLFAAVMVCVGTAVSLGAQGNLFAQEPEQFVDLSVEITVSDDTTPASSKVYLYVSNLGNQTAYDVDVEAHIQAFVDIPPTVGTYNTSRNSRPPDDLFEWYIPELPSYTEYSVRFRGTLGGANPTDTVLDHHYATIASRSYERPDRMHNNGNEIWEIWLARRAGPAEPDYSVRVTAQSASTSSANFTITAARPDRTDGESVFKDGCVNIRLTSGLTAGTPTFTKVVTEGSTPVPATDRSFDTSASRNCGGASDATGVFKVPEYHEDLESIMTLPVTVNSGATLSEQCLTAEIFASPTTGPGRFYDDKDDNEAKVCPWAPPSPPTNPLQSGEISAFTLYPCVGITTEPCDNTDDVRVRVTVPGHDGFILDSGTAVIHVQDHPLARAFDSHGGSVNSGDAVSWQTSCHQGSGSCTEINPGHDDPDREEFGVKLGWNRIPFNTHWRRDGPPATGSWDGISINVSAEGKDEGTDPPGNMNIRFTGSRSAAYTLSADNDYSHTWRGTNPWKPSGDTQAISWQFAEFERLGTYVVDYTLRAKHNSEAGDCDTEIDADDNPDSFCGTETLVFHVGPTADLSVAEGAANADFDSGQYAITVAAMNNGPDYATGAEVNIDLSLPDGVTVEETIESDGTYSGNKWDLGALKTARYRTGVGKPESATLTFILNGDGAASARATATIANVDNYTVCINSKGHTLLHTSQTDCEDDDATTNDWYAAVCVKDSDGTVNTAATHDTQAECEALTDAHTWTTNVCASDTSDSGKVRTGRTEAECDGWFQGTVYDQNSANNTATITAAEGTGGLGTEEDAPKLPGDQDDEPASSSSSASVTVRWKPVPTVNSVAVTHYLVQRGTNPWEEEVHRVDGTEYVDTTVLPGRTYQYRARAVNGANVPGPWSAPVEARAPAPPRASAPTGTSGGDGNQGSGSSRSSRSSDDDDDDYTHFAALETTRAVAENSAAGSAVGNPVVAQANPGNRVTYYLEGKDAASVRH